MRALTPQEFIRERLDNCQVIAATKVGKDRDGWLQDAAHFANVLDAMTVNAELLAALDDLRAEMSNVDPWWGNLREAVERAEAAIAKAEALK